MWNFSIVTLTIIIVICLCQNEAKILRNNALINKMVSNFHSRDNNVSPEKTEKEEYQPEEVREPPTEQVETMDQEDTVPLKSQKNYDDQEQTQDKLKEQPNVVALMQKVLCKNFPTIPCDIIIKDDTLKRLIQKSVAQIKQKQLESQNFNPYLAVQTQSPVAHLTFFPVVDSEDLSNFLLVRDPVNVYTTKSTDIDAAPTKHKKKHKKKAEDGRLITSRRKQILNSKDTGSVIEGSRKKIRRFYPHKMKASAYAEKHSLPTYSEERTSMSVEVPDTGVIRKRHLPVHADEDYPPVWRIDYLKHGEPSIARINHENDYFQGRITKTGDNVIVDENVLEPAARRDVLHPDLYIKKNYGKKLPPTVLL